MSCLTCYDQWAYYPFKHKQKSVWKSFEFGARSNFSFWKPITYSDLSSAHFHWYVNPEESACRSINTSYCQGNHTSLKERNSRTQSAGFSLIAGTFEQYFQTSNKTRSKLAILVFSHHVSRLLDPNFCLYINGNLLWVWRNLSDAQLAEA